MKKFFVSVFLAAFFAAATATPATAVAKLPIPFLPKGCDRLAADAYAAKLEVLNAESAVARDVQFFKEHPEMKNLLQLSGKKLKAEPPSEKAVAKAAETESRALEACDAEKRAAEEKRRAAIKAASQQICAMRTDADGSTLAALCKELGIAPNASAAKQ